MFQTTFGFHILKRRLKPTSERISAQRILIRYRSTIPSEPPYTDIERSRERAEELANRLASEARQEQTSFDELVRMHSDAKSDFGDGDFGVWKTDNPGFLPREVELISTLAIGQVSQPIDSMYGFQVFLRVPAHPRETYAATALRFDFNPNDSESFRHAESDAQHALKTLRQDPSRFGELQTQRCCKDVVRWEAGRGVFSFERALRGTHIGEISPRFARTRTATLILKRVDPIEAPLDPSPLYEIPRPARPDYNAFVQSLDSSQIKVLSAAFCQFIASQPHWSKAEQELIDASLTKFVAHATDDGPNRTAAFDKMLNDVESSLSPEQGGRFIRTFDDWTSELLMFGRIPQLQTH